MNRPHKYRGFTLLELMITVAVIGVLAAIVYPSYRQQMMKTNRGTEGLATLQDLAAKQERYYSKNSTYTTDPADLGSSATTPKGNYTISIEGSRLDGAACDITRCFTITANAAGSQVDDEDCQSLSIDSSGAKAASPDTQGRCWP